MSIATIRPAELGGKQLVCMHGMTTHGRTPSRKSTDPSAMLAYHRQRLPRCDCRIAGSPLPAARPALVERKAVRPAPPTPRRAPASARKAPLKPTEAEILEAVAAVQAEHRQIPHESWAAVEPAVRLAKQELGLGQLDVRFFLAGGEDDPPRGLVHKDYPRLVWVRLDQSIPEQLEAACHEVAHLKQLRDGDRRPEAAREAEAVRFGEHWGAIFRKDAYRVYD